MPRLIVTDAADNFTVYRITMKKWEFERLSLNVARFPIIGRRPIPRPFVSADEQSRVFRQARAAQHLKASNIFFEQPIHGRPWSIFSQVIRPTSIKAMR